MKISEYVVVIVDILPEDYVFTYDVFVVEVNDYNLNIPLYVDKIID